MASAVVLVAAVLTGPAAAPAAAAPASGTVEIRCTAEFPHLPATSWTWGGTATVAATGIDDFGRAFAVSGPGTFRADFSYHEPCLFLSFAEGVLEIDGGSYDVRGRFSWSRVGLIPTIVVWDLLVVSDTAYVTAPGNSGWGTAAFVPPGTFDPATHLLCGQPGGPLSIDVVIAANVLA